MKTKRFVSLCAAAMALFAISTSFAAEVGKKAPEFTLEGIDGKTYSLSDYAGKTVVLEWTNYGCPFVKKHYNSGNMQALQAEAAGKDVVWFSICSSAPGKQGHMSVKDWKNETAKQGVASHAVLLDEGGNVGRSYNAKVTPHMFVINPEGTLVYDGAIDSIPSASQSDIAKAEAYVKNAIEATLAGKEVEKKLSKPYGCSIKYSRDS